MKSKVFQLRLSLEAADELVVALCAEVESHLSAMAVVRFEICLAEALANLVIHADVDDTTKLAEVQLTMVPDGVEITVLDPIGTKPFDLRQHAKHLSELSPMAESGRGLGLILECSDGVEHQFSDQRNKLSLSFRNRQE